jgi:hypothetical protein
MEPSSHPDVPGHRFTLTGDDLPDQGIRATCTCGYRVNHAKSAQMVFMLVDGHISEVRDAR